MKPRGWWIDAAIVLLALTLRAAWIEVKPLHFDEGVNGWFVDQMTRTGFYHYEPGNFHGPLHFYALFVSLTLFGREVWALRLPVVIVSTLCVAAVLAFRRYLPERAARLAALAMAVSPGCVFYGRYSIHESWLLLFLLMTSWGILGLWRDGGRTALWATALGITGMILTKETYVLHGAAFVLAAPALLLVERFPQSAPGVCRWTNRDFLRALTVSAALILFFYTGGLLDWSSLPGLGLTFLAWVHTGTGGESGHEKSWHYLIELIAAYEWPALLGSAAMGGLAIKRASGLARYLALYGSFALLIYSAIPYKTPWCVLVLIWPFYFVFGMAMDWLFEWLDRWTVGVLTALLLAFSLGASCALNFRKFADEDEPYVYVQTLPDIHKLLDPLRALIARDVENYGISGEVMTVDQHPLIWHVGDCPNVEFLAPKDEPSAWDAAFLLVDETVEARAEAALTQSYFKEKFRLRGDANESEVLYLNAEDFAFYFPGREPEFVPTLR